MAYLDPSVSGCETRLSVLASRDRSFVESGLTRTDTIECDCLKPFYRCCPEDSAILFDGEASPIAIL